MKHIYLKLRIEIDPTGKLQHPTWKQTKNPKTIQKSHFLSQHIADLHSNLSLFWVWYVSFPCFPVQKKQRQKVINANH